MFHRMLHTNGWWDKFKEDPEYLSWSISGGAGERKHSPAMYNEFKWTMWQKSIKNIYMSLHDTKMPCRVKIKIILEREVWAITKCQNVWKSVFYVVVFFLVVVFIEDAYKIRKRKCENVLFCFTNINENVTKTKANNL